MTMVFEIQYHLWLDTSCQNQISWKKLVGRKNLAGRLQTMSIWLWWLSEQYQHLNNQLIAVYIHIWSLIVRACSYRYCLMKNNTEWTISAPTTSSCEVRLFEVAVIGTIILSVMKNNTRHWQNLENFFWGKKTSRRKWESEIITENLHTSYL